MSTAVSLYTLEDDLLAMLNSIDMVEDPEARSEAEQAIIAQHMAAVEKRDRVAHFLAHCENQSLFIDDEIDRLQALKKHFDSARVRVENMVMNTIIAIGQDDNGKWRKLEGRTSSFSLAKKPLATVITDEDAVPDEFKDVTLKVSYTDYAKIDSVLGVRAKSVDITVRKADVKQALASGDVPGATMGPLQFRLQRK